MTNRGRDYVYIISFYIFSNIFKHLSRREQVKGKAGQVANNNGQKLARFFVPIFSTCNRCGCFLLPKSHEPQNKPNKARKEATPCNLSNKAQTRQNTAKNKAKEQDQHQQGKPLKAKSTEKHHQQTDPDTQTDRASRPHQARAVCSYISIVSGMYRVVTVGDKLPTS